MAKLQRADYLEEANRILDLQYACVRPEVNTRNKGELAEILAGTLETYDTLKLKASDRELKELVQLDKTGLQLELTSCACKFNYNNYKVESLDIGDLLPIYGAVKLSAVKSRAKDVKLNNIKKVVKCIEEGDECYAADKETIKKSKFREKFSVEDIVNVKQWISAGIYLSTLNEPNRPDVALALIRSGLAEKDVNTQTQDLRRFYFDIVKDYIKDSYLFEQGTRVVPMDLF